MMRALVQGEAMRKGTNRRDKDELMVARQLVVSLVRTKMVQKKRGF